MDTPAHVIVIPSTKGDDFKAIWDPNIPAEVEAARKTFKDLKEKGYIAYSVKPGGEVNEIIDAFDPALGKIRMRPPMVGG